MFKTRLKVIQISFSNFYHRRSELIIKYNIGFKVRKVAKIRNRYNQVPHLTQDTNGKVTNSQKTPQTRAKRSALSQQVTTKHTQTDAHKTSQTQDRTTFLIFDGDLVYKFKVLVGKANFRDQFKKIIKR